MKTCLVVDDSSVVRKIARRILEGLEFEVTEAEDGSKALEVCQQKLPDAVLLDWNMPVMDGFEFMGHMRRPAATSPRWCSAPPKTTWLISLRRSAAAPTSTS
jgi:two-component system, chemotaxis family, chemotaxis protein CheY